MATIDIEGDRLVVRAEGFERRDALTISGAGPRKNRTDIATLPLNVMSWYEVTKMFGPDYHSYTAAADRWREEELRLTRFGAKVNSLDLDVWGQPDEWDWQTHAAARLAQGSALIAADRGTGKTRVVIEAIRSSQIHGERKAVVVCGKRLRAVWNQAGAAWWDAERIVVPTASTWSEAAALVGSATITVLTYDSLLNLDIQKAVKKLDPEWLVLDEAHNLKKRARKGKPRKDETKQHTKSGALRSLPGRRRVALTGSPMPNRWHEIWALLNFVAPEVFTSFWQFVEILGSVSESYWGGKVISDDIRRMDIWNEIYDRWVVTATRPSHGKVWDFVPVELSAKERSAYRAMQKEMRVEMDGQVLEASTPLAQATRLQQLAGGFGQWETKEAEDGRMVSKYRHDTPSAKLDLLLEMLDGLQRAVVWTRFRDRAEFVSDYLSCGVLFTGAVSEAVTQERLARFLDVERYPSPQVAICVYGTISEGINELVAASDVFFLDWITAKDVDQAADRCDRPGQTRQVRCVTLYAKDTVDELAIDREAKKVKPLREILRSPQAWRWLIEDRVD